MSRFLKATSTMSFKDNMAKNRKNKITVLVPTYNVEKTIGRCLKSVAWADEILVCLKPVSQSLAPCPRPSAI